MRAIATFVLLLAGSPAAAQVAGAIDLGGGLGELGGAGWQREMRLAPSLRAQGAWGYLGAEGVALERAGSLILQRAALNGAYLGRPWGALRPVLTGHYSTDASAPLTAREQLDVGAALSAQVDAGGRTGVWLGVASALGRGVERGRRGGAGAALQIGAWRALGGAIVSVTSRTHTLRFGSAPGGVREITYWDSIYTDTAGWYRYQRTQSIVDSATPPRFHRWSDLEARIDWTVGRVVLSATMATRAAVDSTPALLWGRVNAAVEVRPNVSLVGGVGTMPIMSRHAYSARFATVGVRLAPAALLRPPLPAAVRPVASAFRVESGADGVRFVLRVPGARTVDLSGDFAQWAVIPLRRTSADEWEVTLPLPPGTYRVNVRLDGDRWLAPPGVPSVMDEFNGRVGLIVVR